MTMVHSGANKLCRTRFYLLATPAPRPRTYCFTAGPCLGVAEEPSASVTPPNEVTMLAFCPRLLPSDNSWVAFRGRCVIV